MTEQELSQLKHIALDKPWNASKLLKEFIKTAIVAEEPKGAEKGNSTPNIRTSAQHRALFLWYGQIEHVCEEQGVTWDRIIQHAHQLRVTKENVHEAGKQLQKALWGKSSTKDLEKNQLNTLIDHFIDLFAKEGVELPPFPHSDPINVRLESVENLKREDYPTPPEDLSTPFDEVSR